MAMVQTPLSCANTGLVFGWPCFTNLPSTGERKEYTDRSPAAPPTQRSEPFTTARQLTDLSRSRSMNRRDTPSLALYARTGPSDSPTKTVPCADAAHFAWARTSATSATCRLPEDAGVSRRGRREPTLAPVPTLSKLFSLIARVPLRLDAARSGTQLAARLGGADSQRPPAADSSVESQRPSFHVPFSGVPRNGRFASSCPARMIAPTHSLRRAMRAPSAMALPSTLAPGEDANPVRPDADVSLDNVTGSPENASRSPSYVTPRSRASAPTSKRVIHASVPGTVTKTALAITATRGWSGHPSWASAATADAARSPTAETRIYRRPSSTAATGPTPPTVSGPTPPTVSGPTPRQSPSTVHPHRLAFLLRELHLVIHGGEVRADDRHRQRDGEDAEKHHQHAKRFAKHCPRRHVAVPHRRHRHPAPPERRDDAVERRLRVDGDAIVAPLERESA